MGPTCNEFGYKEKSLLRISLKSIMGRDQFARVFPKWSRTFIELSEFRKSDRSLSMNCASI